MMSLHSVVIAEPVRTAIGYRQVIPWGRISARFDFGMAFRVGKARVVLSASELV
jgi:hypothetical protein